MSRRRFTVTLTAAEVDALLSVAGWIEAGGIEWQEAVGRSKVAALDRAADKLRVARTDLLTPHAPAHKMMS